MHPALKQQLEQYGLEWQAMPENLQQFLQTVDFAYQQAEQERATLERLNHFLEASTHLIYQTDGQGYFTYANSAALRLLKLNTMADMVGRHYLEFICPEKRAYLKRFYFQQFRRKERITYQEFRLCTENDEEIWIGQNIQPVMSGAEIVGFQAVARDITERKNFEEQLQTHRDFAKQILAHMGQGITLVNSQNEFLYVNPAYAQMLGYTQDEIVNKTPFDFVHPNSRDILEKERRRRQGDTASTYEVALQGKNGRIVPVLVTGTPYQFGRGVQNGSIAVITDLTQQKHLEESLKQARDQALEASRLKSDFLANMSHEIRTPLNGVIGATELLAETALDNEQVEYVDIVKISSNMLLALINDVLDFSKISAGKINLENQPFDLHKAVEDALEIVAQKAAQKGLELAYLVSPDLPLTVIGDIVRVRQILVNLVSNAVKFTEQGEVVVSVEWAQNEASESVLHFSVRDTGIGIPEAYMPHLFDSFSQVDSSTTRVYGGTGLGLAISKKLAEYMGGTMWVESVIGQGSTFHFTIRLAAAPDNTDVFADDMGKLAGKRLLIVDDNETNRLILIRQAEILHMKPTAAASAAEALMWLNKKRPFDLAILNMQMPGMDGYALAEEIRALPQYAAMPLILLSSLGQTQPGTAAENLFAAHLAKPIKFTALRKILQEVYGSSLGTKRDGCVASATSFTHKKPLRILLAEDNNINQKVSMGILAKIGYTADLAADGLQVIQALADHTYDVVLMDIQMPNMDGLKATQHIRSHTPPEQQPYIVAMTANAVKGDRERFLAAGMDDYISKPLRIESLKEILTNIYL
ncbi:MAG: response regulator [Ardenticatenaceae bacterium]|nr:response regulator [Ardenticatenaceae bacterium]